MISKKARKEDLDDVLAVFALIDAPHDDPFEGVLNLGQRMRLEIPLDRLIKDIGPATTVRLLQDGLDNDVQDAAAVLPLPAMDEDVAARSEGLNDQPDRRLHTPLPSDPVHRSPVVQVQPESLDAIVPREILV